MKSVKAKVSKWTLKCKEVKTLKKVLINPKTKLTAEVKLLESPKLVYLAKELKKAALIKFNPELTDEEINCKVKEIFLSARAYYFCNLYRYFGS